MDLFVTKTANPYWEEVQRELLPGQKAMGRPDLIPQVFQLKKKAMLEDIFKTGIFGKCVARVLDDRVSETWTPTPPFDLPRPRNGP
jgi:Helitron helicase-like domain at N-terminus